MFELKTYKDRVRKGLERLPETAKKRVAGVRKAVSEQKEFRRKEPIDIDEEVLKADLNQDRLKMHIRTV